MARKPRIFFAGAIYHTYFRGNQKRLIFRHDSDYSEYINRLEEIAQKEEFSTIALSLMPNHGHIILQQKTDNPLSNLMQRLQGGFTQYWNAKYQKVGHIFQGRYKAPLCNDEKYLLELIRYVHLNAPQAGLVTLPEDYKWCSHRTYLSPEIDSFIHTDIIESYFKDIQSFDAFIKSGIKDPHNKEINLAIKTALNKGKNHPIPTLTQLYNEACEQNNFTTEKSNIASVSDKIKISFIKSARAHGYSLSDISGYLGIGRTTLYRLTK